MKLKKDGLTITAALLAIGELYSVTILEWGYKVRANSGMTFSFSKNGQMIQCGGADKKDRWKL
jgi:hypothetical protein